MPEHLLAQMRKSNGVCLVWVDQIENLLGSDAIFFIYLRDHRMQGFVIDYAVLIAVYFFEENCEFFYFFVVLLEDKILRHEFKDEGRHHTIKQMFLLYFAKQSSDIVSFELDIQQYLFCLVHGYELGVDTLELFHV
jgi:hypothetical protein